MPKKDAAFVQTRFTAMQNAKDDDFDDRWERNNRRKFSFLRNDGAVHLANSWVVCNGIAEEVTNEFDGSVVFIPTAESTVKEGFQYDRLTKIYNQETKKINTEKERKGAIFDSICYGIGVLFEGYLETDNKDVFVGLMSQRIDVRDFFMDDEATKYYDPLGIDGAQDCIRRRRYKREVFESLFSKEPFNVAAVKNTAKGGGTGDTREDQTEINLNEQEHESDKIEVLEYWSKDQHLIATTNGSELIFDGKNPYGRLPFVVYTPHLEFETLYPPSVLELVAPVLKQKDISVNMWSNLVKLLSTPIIFAADDTGLTAGQELRGGVQPVDLKKGINIQEKIQQVQLGNDPAFLQQYIAFLNDEFTVASGQDINALLAKPQELATQTKQKVATQVKRLRGIITTMMVDAESQRAMLRSRSIIRFIFNKDRDILINDFALTADDKLRSSISSQAKIEIQSKDWEGFEYSVIIRPASEDEVTQEETRNQLLRMAEIFFESIFPIFPELKEKFSADTFLQQIMDTFPQLDTSELFAKEESESKIEGEIGEALRGGKINVGVEDQKTKESNINTLVSKALDQKDPLKTNKILDLLLNANAKKPPQQVQEAQDVATAGVQ